MKLREAIAKKFLLLFPTASLLMCSCNATGEIADKDWQDNASLISVTVRGKSCGYTASVYESMLYKRNGATAISIKLVYDEYEETQIDYKNVEYLIITKSEDKTA